MSEIEKFRSSLQYYEDKALPQSDLIIETAQKSYENGAIGYLEYFRNIDQALKLKFDYLENLNNYNQAVIKLEYLYGE